MVCETQGLDSRFRGNDGAPIMINLY